MGRRPRWRGTLTSGLALALLAGAAYLVERQEDESDGEPADEAEDESTPVDIGGDVVTVKRISDGDSFDANLASGGSAEVRLIGINAPDFGECQYRESRSAFGDLLRGGVVTLQRDVSDRDQYGRLLRYVDAGGVFVNREMLERGLAITISTRPDTSREADLAEAQGRARAAGLGVWNPNACGPAASTAVQIAQVEEDPPGRDQDDLDGEYVVVANHGDTPVDMTGWKLRDDSTRNRFWFPEGFTLPPGGTVTVHVGSGDDTDVDLYWGRRYPVWDNGRDTALLLDPNGNVAAYLDTG